MELNIKIDNSPLIKFKKKDWDNYVELISFEVWKALIKRRWDYGMNEKRFTWKTEKLQHLDDEIIMVVDNENKEWKGHILNIVDKLNELAEENDNCKNDYRELFSNYVALEEKNEQLRHELDSLTGCYCADNKEFKDYWRIGYDD